MGSLILTDLSIKGQSLGVELLSQAVFPMGKVPRHVTRRTADFFTQLGSVGGKFILSFLVCLIGH